MKKIVKIFIAIIGAVDIVFSIFIPMSISLLLINLLELTNFQSFMLVLLGIVSSFYRAIRVGFLE